MPVRPPNRFRWSPETGQYIRANGRFVPRSEVRRAIDTAMRAETVRAKAITNNLRHGGLTLEAWRAEMRDIIKTVHTYSAAAAKGGWAQVTAADYGRVGAIVKNEYGFLERLAQRIANGTLPLDGRVVQYAMQYAQAGRDTYYQTERALMAALGKTEEKNILGMAEHCLGCIEERDKGWSPLGSLVPIGRRLCRRNCKCSLIYR